MRIAKLLILPVFLIASPVFATTSDDPVKPEASSALAGAKVKKICRATTDTGSIVPKRICHSSAEWAAIDSQNADAAQRMLEIRGARQIN